MNKINASLFGNSNQALNYSKFRPQYPPQLYERILSFLQQKLPQNGNIKHYSKAVDVACGSGQATLELTEYFDHVYGIDISEAQLKEAKKHGRITYQQGSDSDLSSIAPNSVDLVTVAQGAHWFDLPSFFQQIDKYCFCSQRLQFVA
eukprot:Sdes_comp19964_c0_seq2m12512